jgi:hypothetical protein
MTLRTAPKLLGLAAALLLACLPRLASQALAQDKRPNIIFIMGDDIGWSNIGVYNQGMMAGRSHTSTDLPTKACVSPTSPGTV